MERSIRIPFTEFGDFEIWPGRRRNGELLYKGHHIGWVRRYQFDTYVLILKGIRFQDGRTKFAPGARGKQFHSLDAVQAFLQAPETLETIQQAGVRRWLSYTPAIRDAMLEKQ